MGLSTSYVSRAILPEFSIRLSLMTSPACGVLLFRSKTLDNELESSTKLLDLQAYDITKRTTAINIKYVLVPTQDED